MGKIVIWLLKSTRTYRLFGPIVEWASKRIWDRRARQFFSKFIKRGDLCFDIGANIGNRTEIFTRLGATVIAVEPQEVCAKEIDFKYKGKPNVVVIQKAVGAKEGLTEIMINTGCNCCSSLSKEWIGCASSGRLAGSKWDRKEMVQVTTLDKLINEYGLPKFCKIDVEGFEFEVIKGLSSPIRSMSLEFHAEFLEPTISSIKKLSDLGLNWFNYSVAESMILSLKKWVNANDICDILKDIPDKGIYGDLYATASAKVARCKGLPRPRENLIR